MLLYSLNKYVLDSLPKNIEIKLAIVKTILIKIMLALFNDIPFDFSKEEVTISSIFDDKHINMDNK